MAKKKNQKRQRSRTEELKHQAEQEKIADEKDRSRKRMNPTTRLLLYGDIIFLAIASILDSKELLSDTANVVSTIIGIVILLIALWFQFGKKKGRDGLGRGPRL